MEETMAPAIESRWHRLFVQLSKFVLVGGINTGIDFAVFNALSYLTGITSGLGLSIINIISFSVAVTNSYFMNKHWTFQDKNREQEAVKFSTFIIVSVLAAGLNTTIVTVITSFISPLFGLSPTLWANVAKLVATGASMVWNFVGYKLFVFKSVPTATTEQPRQ